MDTPCCSGSQTQGRGPQAWGRSAECWGCRVRPGVICLRTCLGARADLAKCSSKGPWVVARRPSPGSDTPEVGNQGQVTQPWFRWHGQPSGAFFSPTTGRGGTCGPRRRPSQSSSDRMTSGGIDPSIPRTPAPAPLSIPPAALFLPPGHTGAVFTGRSLLAGCMASWVPTLLSGLYSCHHEIFGCSSCPRFRPAPVSL